MKQYCPVCGNEQEVKIVKKEETYPVKGEQITIQATVCTCAQCGEELMSFEYDDDNLRKAYAEYRTRHGLRRWYKSAKMDGRKWSKWRSATQKPSK